MPFVGLPANTSGVGSDSSRNTSQGSCRGPPPASLSASLSHSGLPPPTLSKLHLSSYGAGGDLWNWAGMRMQQVGTKSGRRSVSGPRVKYEEEHSNVQGPGYRPQTGCTPKLSVALYRCAVRLRTELKLIHPSPVSVCTLESISDGSSHIRDWVWNFKRIFFLRRRKQCIGGPQYGKKALKSGLKPNKM